MTADTPGAAAPLRQPTRTAAVLVVFLQVLVCWVRVDCVEAGTGTGEQISGGFTDSPLVPGVILVKPVHFRELRDRINALRAREGLPPVAWTDATLTPGVTRVRRVHLTELRTALDAAYSATGRPSRIYTDATVMAGTTPFRVPHIRELRIAIVALENNTPGLQIASLVPSAPGFGPTEAGKRSQEPIIVTVTDAFGAPIAGATWRFRTDDRSGWAYPAEGTTAADGRIVVSWVAGSPGVGASTLTVDNAVSSLTTELATESVASQRPPIVLSPSG